MKKKKRKTKKLHEVFDVHPQTVHLFAIAAVLLWAVQLLSIAYFTVY